MDLRIFTEPHQGATYEQLLAVALEADRAGFGAFFRSDHYLHMGDPPPGSYEPLPGPTDAWITLAGLARDTERIRLGTLLSAGTFRYPGPLAVTVAQVDAMSGGRVELGLGAGWFAEEHSAYGIPFPARLGERIERLEEQLAIVRGLWRTPVGERYSFSGRHYELVDSPALPKPFQRPNPPIIVGGTGTKRTPALAARFADECNVPFRSADHAGLVFGALDDACRETGRDPASIVRSIALTACCAESSSQLTRRAAAIGKDLDELRADGLAGTPDDLAERLADYAAVGVTRVYLQVLDLSDLEHVGLLGERLSPLVT
ncbi:MAG: F420-dependent oxidoreductase [Acidimicrobiaceae bacterium]|nr:F420-dependent oxidoreductase [Acidimicrobiaceae bacterium]